MKRDHAGRAIIVHVLCYPNRSRIQRFISLGLAFERKQIPRFIGNVRSDGWSCWSRVACAQGRRARASLHLSLIGILDIWRLPSRFRTNLLGRLLRRARIPARVALEALALEGYRSELLSESAVRQMLGFETRIQVHAFLKEHGIHLHYDLSDLDSDRITSERLRAKRSGPEPTNEPHCGWQIRLRSITWF
jgi:hypothetical protein